MSDCLDEVMLAELAEIMEDEFPLLLETFLSESAAQHEAVQAGWQAEDMVQLHRRAHALKGSCANVGAVRCAELCRDIEQAASNATSDHIPSILERLDVELRAVHQALSLRL